MLHCPITKQFCLALCTVKCDLVSERVARANPLFFICFRINKISNSGAAMIIRLFHLHIQKQPRILYFSVPFAKYSPFTSLEKSSERHCNPNTHCSPQFRANFLYTILLVLWLGTFLEDEMSIPEHFHQ